MGIGLGTVFFYLYHTFRNGIFFVVGIGWFLPRFVSSTFGSLCYILPIIPGF